MACLLLRRVTILRSVVNSHLFSSSRVSLFPDHDRLPLSPLFSETGKDDINDCKIELIDDATWHLSSGLVEAWRSNHEEKSFKMRSSFSDRKDNGDNRVDSNQEIPDFDTIEDMRIRGNLFYKLDKASKEYEEHKFEFHGRKFGRNKKDVKDSKEKKKENSTHTLTSKVEMPPKKDRTREIEKKKESFHDVIEKPIRTPTFNQLTAPYHEPFCLDIYVSKGSVRASIIHRATSNVVVVSHSISKDMKFDLGSTKNKSACAAVGKVLAQRALADDIHNVVYTPRKGDKLEGKLHIVLKSIVDGGVEVKVKLKQTDSRRRGRHLQTTNKVVER